MAKTKVLISVKTYPALSGKYHELVCTAGFLEDGSWIRIYPVPFRFIDYKNQYKKWEWIEIDLKRNVRDFRPESFRPVNIENQIKCIGKVGTDNYWQERKMFVLKNVYTNMTTLINKSKSDDTSLAVFKPTKIIDFIIEKTDREWDEKKLKKIYADMQQGNLFEPDKSQIKDLVKKVPYKFSYKFLSEDGKKRCLMIEDWEIGALYWNCLKEVNGDENAACNLVRDKYFTEFLRDKDIYFFLGTTFQHHKTSLDPFVIIGVFYPPKEPQKQQLSLFD